MDKTQLLENSGIKILTVINKDEKLSLGKNYDYMCGNNHTWNARLSNVIRGLDRASKGCPHCAKNVTDEISQQALERNLLDGHKCISFEVKQVKSDGTRERFYKIQCPFNHIYEKRTPTLKEGCPQCSTGVFVGEERVRVIFETYFKKPFKKVRPDWLRNPISQMKLELDGYNEDLKIAFEYQGRQHYSNNTQFAGHYTEQSNRDNIKKDLCLKHGITLYEIKQSKSYGVDLFVNEILMQLKEQGLIIENTDFDFSSINNEQSLKEKYQEFKKLVDKQNLILETKSLSTMEDNLAFICQNNHRFHLTGAKFKEIVQGNKRTYFCEECEKSNGNSTKLINTVFGIDDVRDFVKKIGFEVLSTTYKNVNEPMKWRCNHGHEFEKNFRAFQRNKTNTYCEQCVKEGLITKPVNRVETRFGASNQIVTIEKIQEFVRSIGYEVLSTTYKNVNEPMKWRCNHGHEFEKNYRTFQRNKTGVYCEQCVKEGLVQKFENRVTSKFGVTEKGISLEDIKIFVQSIGYEVLSTTYKNVNEPMMWRCNQGHEFEKSYRTFQRNATGKYCPHCKKIK